jgi:zinc protease
MVKETHNRLAPELAREIEALGTSIGRVSHDDYFGFTLATLNRNFPYAFDVLFDILANASFNLAELNKEREAQLSAIQGIEDQSGVLASQLLRSSTFHGHPYGFPDLGSPSLIKYVDIGRIAEHHAETVRPEAMVLTVVGDVDAETVHEFLLLYLQGWHPTGDPVPRAAPEFYSKERVETVPTLLGNSDETLRKDRAQSVVMMAYHTVPRSHDDVYPLEVLQSITGGMGGTFFEEIRTRRGLAYQVSTFDQSNYLAGYFGAFVACSPESTEVVKGLLGELMAGLATDPPSPQQIENAQNHLAGAHRVGLQTNRAQSGYLASLELLGLDLAELEEYPERIRAVTQEDLARVAREYFEGKYHAVVEVAGRSGSSPTP